MNEKRLILYRDDFQDERTLGQLYVGNKWIAETMEPGSKDRFRLPAGFYLCVPHGWEPNSAFRFKQTWALVGANVSHQPEPGIDHAAVLFHRGVRDEHTDGCILTASSRGTSQGEPAILEAVTGEAMERLRRVIGGPWQFFLTIKEGRK